MARLWPAAALLALLLPGCFSFGFEQDFDDDEGMDDDHRGFWLFPMGGFLLFALVVAGVVVLIVNLSNRPAPPPPPPQQPQEDADEAKPARRR